MIDNVHNIEEAAHYRANLSIFLIKLIISAIDTYTVYSNNRWLKTTSCAAYSFVS